MDVPSERNLPPFGSRISRPRSWWHWRVNGDFIKCMVGDDQWFVKIRQVFWVINHRSIRSISNCQIPFTSSTAQGGGGSFKNRKPIGKVGCCESGMAERSHWWKERCLRSPLFLSLSLTIYLPTYLSIYLSIDRSIDPSPSLSLFHLITYLSIYLSIYRSIDLSIYLSISLSFI